MQISEKHFETVLTTDELVEPTIINSTSERKQNAVIAFSSLYRFCLQSSKNFIIKLAQ